MGRFNLAVDSYKNFDGTVEERLDAAEALIASLAQNIGELAKQNSDLSQSLLLLLEGMTKTNEAVRSLNKKVDDLISPQLSFSPRNKN